MYVDGYGFARCYLTDHAYGVPVDLAQVRRRLPPHTPIIEDAAQAWGSGTRDAPTGSGGELAVFSFGRGKGITGGSGGALLVRDSTGDHTSSASPESGPKGNAAGWRDVAVALALWTLARPNLYGIPSALPGLRLGETRFKSPRPVGAISRAAGAIVLATLAEADREAARRRLVANRLRALIDTTPELSNVRAREDSLPGWLRLPVLADSVKQRDRLVREGRALGVAAGYPRPLPDLARTLGWQASSGFRGAEALAARLFTLPTHDCVTDAVFGRLERLIARH